LSETHRRVVQNQLNKTLGYENVYSLANAKSFAFSAAKTVAARTIAETAASKE